MADAGVFSAINVCFKFVDFCMKVNDVSLENQVFVRIISRVREDREESFRLMRKPAVQRHFELDPDSRKYVEGTILALDKALQSIGKFVESVRLDEERNGSIGLVNRFEWVLRHQAKLGTRQLELNTCHQSLLQAMDRMQTFERDPLPPSYSTATNLRDDDDDGSYDILVAPRRRLQLRKESQNPTDLDNTTDEKMDTKSLNSAMEELHVQDGFTPLSEGSTQEFHTLSRVTTPPSDTFEQMVAKESGTKSDPPNKGSGGNLSWEMLLPSTKSEWSSNTAARPGWERFEPDLKPLEQSSTSCSVGGSGPDMTPSFQEANQIGIGEPVKPSHLNCNLSNLSSADTVRPSRSSCSLSSNRPSVQESTSSLRSISPLQSPTPSNIDPILLSSPLTLQNDSSVIQSTRRSSSPLQAAIQQSPLPSVYPGLRASTLPTPAIPLRSTLTMDPSLSSLFPEPTVMHTPSRFTAIAPPANTAGYYSPRYHQTPYQPYELISGLIPVSELNSTQSFQGGTNDRSATVRFAMERPLPEVVSTNLPQHPSQIGVVDTTSKFSIPRKSPNDPPALAMNSPPFNEVQLADTVRLRDVRDQISEIGTNTTSYDMRPELTSEDTMISSRREEILKRKARQDLIWGTG